MKRSAPLTRVPLRSRRAPIKKGRPAAETVRIYGPPSRRAWVKSLPCWLCGVTPSQNAHTVNGGKSRKADSATIAPLCGPDRNDCHAKYDQYKPPFRKGSDARESLKAYAAIVEKMWQAKTQSPPAYLHTTDPLCATCGASFREDGEQCASCAYPCDSDS